jgi:integrase
LPRRALTAASVGRIKPPTEGQIEHFDKGFPGLALRVSYGGGKSWVFFYRIGGRQRRLTFGAYPAISLVEARQAWREAKGDVEQGRDPGVDRKNGKPAHDFANVAEEWLKRDQEKNRTAKESRRVIERYVLPAWGGRRVGAIERREVLDLVDSITDRGTPVMARRVQARLHRFFAWCVGRGIITNSPMVGLPRPGTEIRRKRALNDDELVAAWKAAQDLGWPFGTVIQLLILTGARRAEIGALRWPEIEGDFIKLEGARTKNGEPHDIPLSVPAAKLLEEAPRIGTSELVFTTNGRTSISGWSGAKIQIDTLAPLPAWRVHDLRRTVATGMQRLGVGLQVVEAVLGHVSGSRAGIVGIYQRYDYANEKRAALEAWGAHVMALVEGRTPGVVLPIRGKR